MSTTTRDFQIVLQVVKRMVLWGSISVLVTVAVIAAMLGWFSWQADGREVMDARDAAPRAGRYVSAADVSLFVQEAGPAEGKPVLFVHGTGAWSETWRDTLTALAGAGYRAIAIDLPPFGYSQRPGQPAYDKQTQGRRIVAALAALKLPAAIVVGHSFGGGPTVEAALIAPARVRGLVLVDAALAIRPDGSRFEPPSAPLRAVLAARPLRDALVATFLTNPRFTRKLLQAFIYDPARATDARVAIYRQPLTVKGTTGAIGEWLPALIAPAAPASSEDPASYGKLAMPVAVIWGERDAITPLEQGKRIAALAPRAELYIMKGVGHIPQIEDAAGFNEVLLKSLKGLL